MNRGFANRAVFVRPVVWLDKRLRASFHCFVKSVVGVFDVKSDVAHAVAVLFDMLGGVMFGRQWRSQNEIDAVLPQHVTRRFPISRFQAGISRPRKAERFAIIKFGLLGVANVKFDVVYFFLIPKDFFRP